MTQEDVLIRATVGDAPGLCRDDNPPDTIYE